MCMGLPLECMTYLRAMNIIPGSMPAVMSKCHSVQITETAVTQPGGRDDWDYFFSKVNATIVNYSQYCPPLYISLCYGCYSLGPLSDQSDHSICYNYRVM